MSTVKESATICELNDLLFPVEVIHNPIRTNSEYSRIVKGDIDGDEMHLNYCSPRYELVPNVEVFPHIEEVLRNAGVNFSVTYRHLNHVRFYADYTIEDKEFEYRMKGTNDVIKPQINTQHSYNGLTKYKINLGYFRLICSNGLVISVKEMDEYNLNIMGKHTESIRHSFDKLQIMLQNLADNGRQVTKAIVDKYELLGGRWLANPEDRIVEVLEVNKIAMIDNKNLNTVGYVRNIVNVEAGIVGMGYNGKANDWLVYNAINQYLNDDTLNIAAPEKRKETDSKVFEYMLAHAY